MPRDCTDDVFINVLHMNSPASVWDPILFKQLMSVRAINSQRQQQRGIDSAGFQQRQLERAAKYPELYETAKPRSNLGDQLGAATGVISGAAFFNPALAPAAAAAGIGYGTYKLGQSFNLW